MKNPPPSTYSSSSPSFALISVLALVSLAALTATAFLASARLERQATMPLTQTTMLDMALDSGAVAALRLLEYGGAEEFNHVVTYWRGSGANDWTNDLGYLLIGSLQSSDITTNPLKIKYYFCFSSAALTNLGTNLIEYTNHQSAGDQSRFTRQIKQVLEATSARTGINFAAGQSTNIPLLGDTATNRCTSPPVGWVYINQDVRVKPGQTTTTNVPVTRFAFYVQDLSSMIDAERMGGFTNGTPFRQSTALPTNYAQGTNPAEISLTNLTGTALTDATNAANFTSATNRVKYLSPGMLVLPSVGKLNTNDLRYVTTGLRHWTNAYERIPFGLGYSNCGTSDRGTNKFNLSDTNTNNFNVTNISSWITSNLTTNFLARAGGLTNSSRFDYAKCIAANIVDYIDTNSTPSIQTGTNGYRGCEALPLVSEVAIAIQWTNQRGSFTEEFEVTPIVELWNMYDKPFTGTLSFAYNCSLTIGKGPSAGLGVSPALCLTQTPTRGSVTNSFGVTNLQPNQYGVYIMPSRGYSVLSGSAGNEPVYNTGKTASQQGSLMVGRLGAMGSENYSSSWQLSDSNGIVYDKTTAIQEATRTLKCKPYVTGADSRPDWPSHVPSLRLDPGTGGTLFGTGDPRMTWFMTNSTTANGPGIMNASDLDESGSFGYRNMIWKFSVRKGSTNRPDLWLDGGHASSSTGTGPSPGGDYDTTDSRWTSLTTPKTTTNQPSAFIRNGPMLNILELGNIFDPIQYETSVVVTSNNPSPVFPTNITTNSFPNWQQGGGNTLRIGRPEHPRFAWTKPSTTASDPSIPNMQSSAAALLDLFCTTNQFDEGGKINLNTAPAPVLRALAGGIYLRSDPALLPAGINGGTNFSIPPAMAEAFAQGVMRFRAKYPFYSPSQLSFIGTDPTWPNTNTWPTNAVFGNTNTISLVTNSVNTLTNTSLGITEWNDQAAEEWFAKIFKLSTVYSRNFRVYVIAQKATTNSSGVFIGVGPVVRKYYNVLIRENGTDAGDEPGANPVITFQSYY